MARKKIDHVVEAVHYAADGQVELARLYERRGFVWTDRLVLVRAELVERLNQKGKRTVTGTRKKTLGAMFETRARLVLSADGRSIRTEGASGERDALPGVPVF